MDENQPAPVEAEVPNAVSQTPSAAPAPTIPAPALSSVSEPLPTPTPEPVTPAASTEHSTSTLTSAEADVAKVESVVAEAPVIAKSELAHVFDAFEHNSLMEGISRLYALAKKHL